MDLWQTAPALWKEWEGRSNASRGAVPVGERLMFWHMQKSAFSHVSGFPGESSPRELRQRLEHASDDGRRMDPRLSEACRRFHGAWASPPTTDVIVRTVEDAVANRSGPFGRRLRQ